MHQEKVNRARVMPGRRYRQHGKNHCGTEEDGDGHVDLETDRP